MLSQIRVHYAQIEAGSRLARVVLNFLLIILGCLVQFSGDIQIVVGGHRQLLPFAGMVAQLECLGQIFARPPGSAETEVLPAHRQVAHGKIRIKFNGALIVRQAAAGPFSRSAFCPG